jgi:hypothetical protein
MNIICLPISFSYLFFNFLNNLLNTIHSIIIKYYTVFVNCFIWAFFIFYELIHDYFTFMTTILIHLLTYPTIIYFTISLYITLYYIKCYLEIIFKSSLTSMR